MSRGTCNKYIRFHLAGMRVAMYSYCVIQPILNVNLTHFTIKFCNNRNLHVSHCFQLLSFLYLLDWTLLTIGIKFITFALKNFNTRRRCRDPMVIAVVIGDCCVMMATLWISALLSVVSTKFKRNTCAIFRSWSKSSTQQILLYVVVVDVQIFSCSTRAA